MDLQPDIIIIKDLRTKCTVGPDRWDKLRPQPVTISIKIETSLIACCKSDNVADSIHYGHLAKDVSRLVDGCIFSDLCKVAESVADMVLQMDTRVVAVEVEALALNQFLQAESLGVQLRRTKAESSSISVHADKVLIKDLRVNMIIGVNPPERISKQLVIVNLIFHGFDWTKQDWKRAHKSLVEAMEASAFLTLEAFADAVVATTHKIISGADIITVRAQKPSALTNAGSSGIEITRNRAFFVHR